MQIILCSCVKLLMCNVIMLMCTDIIDLQPTICKPFMKRITQIAKLILYFELSVL